ncbi:MAG: hypothetical protein GKC00_07160, partial [Candidatus Methanofastidiosa archaeon]|nr:hypothetical protein [Candidatus Methanofastidiosa archaeon]
MKLLFFLSGGSTLFAKEEVVSLLDSYGAIYKIEHSEGQLLLVNINKKNIEFLYRLGLTHFVLEVISDSIIDEKM